MTIGELAKRCGVSVDTLRYYERRGLIPDPRQAAVGHREYTEDDVRRVGFIKRAQTLGFTLKEISELQALKASPTATCADVCAKAKAKLDDFEERIQGLAELKRNLEGVVSRCKGTGPVADCKILKELEEQP